MDYQTYLTQISANFPSFKATTIDYYDTTVTYEEVFKWEWAATKLKIFSFVSYVNAIDKNLLASYSSACLAYARKHKKGLPIGFQNGIVSNNLLVSPSVCDEAILFATSRPSKHYATFEMPAIFDLSTNVLHYYKGEIIWGMMYQPFIKDYILKKLDIKSQEF